MARRGAPGRSALAALVVLGALAGWAALSRPRVAGARTEATTDTRREGLAAWEKIHSVLTSPRCINCHTATEYPQQGDDRHRHFANVVRGPADEGVSALSCGSCHQEKNADSTGVPGAPFWHLAPLSMRWQDRNDRPLSSSAICQSVRSQGVDLVKHHTEEALVLWAWNPGLRPDGTARSLPPMTHDEFVAATRRWVDAGTPCPEETRR